MFFYYYYRNFVFLLLKELSLISHAYVQSRLVVILLLELAIAIFCLHTDLRQRIVVDAAREDLLACILLRSAEARVVVFEVAEDVHLLTGCAQLLNLREDVVAYFHACGNGVRTEHLIRLVWLHVLCVRLAHSANLLSVANISVVGASACHPVVRVLLIR